MDNPFVVRKLNSNPIVSLSEESNLGVLNTAPAVLEIAVALEQTLHDHWILCDVKGFLFSILLRDKVYLVQTRSSCQLFYTLNSTVSVRFHHHHLVLPTEKGISSAEKTFD